MKEEKMGEVLIAEVLITKSTKQQKEGYFFFKTKKRGFCLGLDNLHASLASASSENQKWLSSNASLANARKKITFGWGSARFN